MDAREITTLMHRLFRGDIPQTDGWVHLIVDGEFDRSRVDSLINRYIQGDELLLFVNAQHCVSSTRVDAFTHIKSLLPHGTVRIADPRFHARILINQIGVGVGSAL